MEHRVLESARLNPHAGTAEQRADAGALALRAASSAYERLREELIEERAITTDLALRLEAARRDAELEENRVHSLLDSIRTLHRTLCAGTTSEHWTEDAPSAGLTPGDFEKFRKGIALLVNTLDAPNVPIALDKDGEFHEPAVRSRRSVGTEAGGALENVRLGDELQRGYVTTIAVLADAVQAKDPYTHGHCEQVSAYARRAALRLGLSDTELRITCYAALLHDVGKIGVSDGVLNKPGPLIAEERKLVEAHVRIGHDLLNVVPALRDIASAVLYHHERYDGCGYPEGLAGERIPMASRIVAVVDAYCAMIDQRSYKEAYTPEHARAELVRCSGSQFDPQVVEAVLAAIDEVDATVTAGGMWESGCGVLPPLREYSAHGDSG